MYVGRIGPHVSAQPGKTADPVPTLSAETARKRRWRKGLRSQMLASRGGMRMGKASWVPILAGLLQVPQAVAGACLPAKVVTERMDEYFINPRSPAAYRALAGLGDPGIKALGSGFTDVAFTVDDSLDWQEKAALKSRMLPEQRKDIRHWMPDEGGCRLDYALWVASKRVAALGGEHPYVRQWFEVQKAVFSSCINGAPWGQIYAPPSLPLPPPIRLADSRLARLQSEDRAYQQASRHFYDQKRAPALNAFRAIARSGSSHAPVARYMMLVTMAEIEPPAPPRREPVTTVMDGGPPPIILASASPPKPSVDVAPIIAEARAILADPRLASIHPLTQALIGSLAWNSLNVADSRLTPGAAQLRAEQIRLILEALTLPLDKLGAAPGAAERYARAASDFDHFQRYLPDQPWLLSAQLREDDRTSREIAAAARRDPLAGWMILPTSPFEGFTAWASVSRSWSPSVRAYVNRQRRDQAWLSVRAAHSQRYDPGQWSRVDRQIARIRNCPADQALASLPTFFYHQVRTALMYGGHGAARRRAFAQVLRRVKGWPWRDGYHFSEAVGDAFDYLIAQGRLAEARQLDSAARLGSGRFSMPRLLLARSEDELVRQMASAKRFENLDGMVFFERLSIAALSRLAARREVPAAYRATFARVAWTRLYATGRPVPRRLDLLMRRLNPEITRGWRSRPGDPADPSLLVDVLASPGLNILMSRQPESAPDPDGPGLTRIDIWRHSDNNWWCAWQIDRHRHAAAFELHRRFLAGPDFPDESKAEDRAPARLRRLLRQSWLWRAGAPAREETRLSKIDCAPKLLAERAIKWNGAGGGGQDEALALAVRATRYGCQRQGGHGAYSRAAFALLHRRYPDSAAAKRTPYWFDCSHFFYDCPAAAPAGKG
jgi:hypothetical protein